MHVLKYLLVQVVEYLLIQALKQLLVNVMEYILAHVLEYLQTTYWSTMYLLVHVLQRIFKSTVLVYVCYLYVQVIKHFLPRSNLKS